MEKQFGTIMVNLAFSTSYAVLFICQIELGSVSHLDQNNITFGSHFDCLQTLIGIFIISKSNKMKMTVTNIIIFVVVEILAYVIREGFKNPRHGNFPLGGYPPRAFTDKIFPKS